MTRPLSELLDVHEELSERFAVHQEQVLAGELAGAEEDLEAYCALLLVHMRSEETLVLPAFEALGLDCERGRVELYRAEHAKILWWLDELRRRLAELRDSAQDPRARIALLDREATFKRVMEHHDLREREYLYPLLDEHAGDVERRRLWRELEALEKTPLPARAPAE
ncbi:MAG TPA: hypothetical protein QF764_10820 [Planctomycetota bacterium]|nr:hypothetical protein [Planctomycetota bacterium]